MITAGLYRNRLIANCITFLAAVVLSFAASHSAQSAQDPLRKLLSERLWNKRDTYDTSHVLMVPMHAANGLADKPRVAEFREFAKRWLHDGEEPDLGELTERQFDYLMTRLTYLETQSTQCGEPSALLYRFLHDRTVKNIAQPAWNWQMEPFPNQLSRIKWKSSQAKTDPSYIKAIFDHDLFSIAASADLATVADQCDWEIDYTIEEIAKIGVAAIVDEGVFVDEGWLFQPGIWTDHPDYRYAGHKILSFELEPKPIANIGWDSSHAHRFPLLFRSWYCYAKGTEVEDAVRKARNDFSQQWTDKVVTNTITMQDVYLNNYMSGHDGVYRYSYATTGEGGGYGPGGLSGTFNLGWWSIIGGAALPFYQHQLNSLPFADEIMALYLQPIVTDDSAPRNRHPLFAPKDYFSGALLQQVLQDAVAVAGFSEDECGGL